MKMKIYSTHSVSNIMEILNLNRKMSQLGFFNPKFENKFKFKFLFKKNTESVF